MRGASGVTGHLTGDLVDVAQHIVHVRRRVIEVLLWTSCAGMAIVGLLAMAGVAGTMDSTGALVLLLTAPLVAGLAAAVRLERVEVRHVELGTAVVIAVVALLGHAATSNASLPTPDPLALLDSQFREFRVLAVLTALGFYTFRTRVAWAYVALCVGALFVIRAATIGFAYPLPVHQQAALANIGQLAAWLLILTYFTSATDWLGEGRARLDAALAQRRRLQAAVAHDIMSPLTAASGLVATVHDHPDLGREASQALLERAGHSIDRVAGIAQDLLRDVGIVGREAPSHARLDHLVGAAIDQSRLRETPVAVVAPPVWVAVPEHSVLRALVNLLDNAQRHGAPPVRVTAAIEPSWIVLRVRDHGPGITLAPDDLFAPFVRGDRVGEGVGLGLHVVAEIARTHGGTISIREVDPGAEVELRLPLAPQATDRVAPRVGRSTTAGAGR